MADSITGVIVKPASNSCNLRCSYCYAEAHVPTANDFMSIKLAKKLVGYTLSQPDVTNVQFVWHGGEPLLRGIGFYREIFEYIQRIAPPAVHVRHALQTNMTLVSDEWLSFLRDWGLNISTSLDGPEWIHNANRINRKGLGTYRDICKKIEMACSAGIQVNTISVVTETSCRHASEIYTHFASLGLKHNAFLPCYVLDSRLRPIPPTIPPGAFGRFLCEVLIFTSKTMIFHR